MTDDETMLFLNWFNQFQKSCLQPFIKTTRGILWKKLNFFSRVKEDNFNLLICYLNQLKNKNTCKSHFYINHT